MSDEKKMEFPQTEVIFGKSQIFPKLESLSCWSECVSLIEMGNKPKRVAKFIQEEKGECLDMSAEALRVGIHRWIQKQGARFVSDQAPSTASHLLESMEFDKTPFQIAQYLLNLQVDRINIDYKIEKQMGKSPHHTTAAIKTANELLKTLASLDPALNGLKGAHPSAAINRDGNLTEEAIKRSRQIHEAKYGAIGKFITDPRARRMLLNAIDGIKSIEMVPTILRISEEPTVPPSKQEA